MSDRLALPPRPQPPEPPPFPLIGVAAPIALAVVLFAVLRTPTVLLLAVFSPVLAVAAVLDGRLQMRRRSRRDDARHDGALAELERELEVRRAAALGAARRGAPSAQELAADPGAWAGRPPSGDLVLGEADVPCAPMVTGTPATVRERELVAAGGVLVGAPFVVPASASVAVVGPEVLVRAVDRAIAVARLRGSGSALGCTILPTAAGAGADLVLELDADGRGRVLHASGPAADCAVRAFRPSLLSAATAARVVADGGPPELAALLADPARSSGLGARFLVGPDGPVDVDLVRDGPHAVVGGTTGSGKSVLLTAWVLALAAAHPPEELVLLLVDHKGGATFDPLADLPHVAGVVTDLDGAEAERTVLSLGAELRRRERAARTAQVADAVAAGLPRLVVVVDEYRAMVEGAPGLAALFADLAARGRSLGVHLILCTQRPGGSVRDEVLANCAVRLSLRVQDAGDSRAVVGTDAAALLGREPVGAAVLAIDGARRVQVPAVDATTVRATVSLLREAHRGVEVVRPWLPPLPEHVALPPAPEGMVPLGLVDLPAEQRRPVLAWDPVEQPRLLIAGDPGSGRTGALRAVAHGLRASMVAASPAALWDRLHRDGDPLLVDDLDHLLDRLGGAHAARAVERLAERLRDPAAAPTAVTVRGPGAWSGLPLRPLVGLFDETLLLRLGQDDHLALGGRRDAWSERSVPGRAWFAGHRAQVAEAPPAPTVHADPPAPMPDGPVLLLTLRPLDRTARLRAAGWTVAPAGDPLPETGAERAALVGSTEDWQAQWQALGRLRTRATVLVEGLATADLRTLLGVHAPLPPVANDDQVIELPAEGVPRRVRLPSAE